MTESIEPKDDDVCHYCHGKGCSFCDARKIKMTESIEQEKTTWDIAAQLWCLPQHAHKPMDAAFCMDIAAAIRREREKVHTNPDLEDAYKESMFMARKWIEKSKELESKLAKCVEALKKCHEVLECRWFVWDGEDEDNDDEVIEVDKLVMKIIESVEGK